ncbi:hypothetical protein ACFQBQ_09370 [Granulicella cerasi]|uniref:Uncharacterized protein n=1 Tax=Granulicella cerasi TaxID=741063 RepID=A0ABW1ZBG7_9BACT|nr:hypothetical protein [Granulicella cerasi]
MANTNIPVAERSLTPAEVAALDRRLRRGHLFIVIGFQTALVAIFVTLWSGQDAQYGPGWVHPMLYWDLLVAAVSVFCFLRGLSLRRGLPEFFSY